MIPVKTFSGAVVDIAAPQPETIHIRDIAHALSFLCRGSGQTERFFPVALHCVYCASEALAEGMSRDIALALLLHDASEAYMADVPGTIKDALLPEYRAAEARLLDVVYRKYIGRALTPEEESTLKRIDNALLQYDLRYLLHMDVPLPPLRTAVSYDFTSFADAEERYLALFARLKDAER